MSTLQYLKNFLTDRNIASITPTSGFGVKKVCSKMDFRRAGAVVEYGPGTGVFTEYLLSRMAPDSRLILLELNRNFVSILRKRFTDPRVRIFHDSAESIVEALAECGLRHADYVISGIPFSFLDADTKDRILANTHEALRPAGKFLAYQMFYQLPAHLRLPLEKRFPEVWVEYELLNVPPLSIYEAVKES